MPQMGLDRRDFVAPPVEPLPASRLRVFVIVAMSPSLSPKSIICENLRNLRIPLSA